jgi:uncharacterized membrane protein
VDGNLVFAFAVGIGFVAGLRSLLAPAVVAWAAHAGWLDLHTTLLGFIGSWGAAIVLSLLATGELIADKTPGIPKRTGAFPLLARIVTGGLCGACLSVSARQSLGMGAILGAVGAVIGAIAGFEARKRLVRRLNVSDIIVALPEDLIAIGLALFFVSR